MKITNSHWDGSKFPPRQWQAEALPLALNAIESQDSGDAPRPIIRAVMGAGKSVLIAEVVRSVRPERGECVVITAPTQKLVRQLSATVAERIGPYSVGQYYAQRKDFNRPVIVACNDSAESLAESLRSLGKSVALLICDEAHRTETEGYLFAAEELDPVAMLGFTATPWRSGSEALSLFDQMIYEYGPDQAIRDGVVVPWKIQPWIGDPEQSIDQCCLKMIQTAADDDLGPGVVNACSIEDAEKFAAKITEELSLPAAAIHSHQSDSEQDRLIEDLRRGDLHCLVHVSLLQEGVDMPWLRWGCLRRDVKSTVRFPQEVGRFLRADKGKTEAVLFDPNDLFSKMKLTLPSALSGEIIEDEELPPVELAVEAVQRERDREPEPLLIRGRPEAMDALSAYIRQVTVAFDTEGIIEQRVSRGSWRKSPPTQKQVDLLWRLKWTLNTDFIDDIPWRHRTALAWCIEYREHLRRGEVSDLIEVLHGLKSEMSWPLFVERMATAPDVDPDMIGQTA